MDIEWKIKEFDKDVSANLSYECEIPRPIANILAGRGILTTEEAKDFCEKNPKFIRSFAKLPDYKKAVDRLVTAINNKEKIFIWGDYDVDGITSTSIVVTAFRLFGANFIYKVPSRFDDGYDIKRHSVDECIKEKCQILMSVDCGIVAFDTAVYAKEKGIDLIITDHHSPTDDGKIPDAIAVVNPSRKDSEYGFAGLCGASVAFKLMLGLSKALGHDPNILVQQTIEFVALGTVADVAPMIDENRILVNLGCKALSNSKKLGIQELLRITGAKEVDSTTIGFQIGPRINAIGRLSDPMIAVELMLETSPQRAKFLAGQLDTANKRRQTKQQHMVEEAIAIVEQNKLYEDSVIVCWAKSWHTGLIGLVAGKLADKYHRPAIVLAVDENGKAKGSCRSTKTVNILQILKHSNVIDYYSKKLDGNPIVGGHAFAAGMEIPQDNLLTFREKVCETLTLLNPDFAPGKKIYYADSKIVPGEINDNTFESLNTLAPFGSGHPEPVFWVRNMVVESQTLLSSNKHIKFILSNSNLKFKKVSALLWHKAADFPDDYTGKSVDLLFSFSKETQGFGSFYLSVIDIKLSDDL
jgi:single-stranded-DNA-specific exonuclease